MGFGGGAKPKEPKPTPVPTIDPATVGQQVEDTEKDEEQKNKQKKREGKKSLTVSRKGTAGTTGVTTNKKRGSGLSVGSK